MKKVKCYIFDLDGTILDSGADLLDSLNFALEQNGLSAVPNRLIGNLVGGGAEAMIKKALKYYELKIDNRKLTKLIEQFISFYERNCSNKSSLYENVLEIIKFLKSKGMILAICTNKMEYLAIKILRELNISQYFDLIVGSNKKIKLKPNTEMLEKILFKLKLKEREAIMIGDSEKDIIPAKKLRMRSIFVNYGYGSINDQIKANFIVDDIIQLKRIYKNLS